MDKQDGQDGQDFFKGMMKRGWRQAHTQAGEWFQDGLTRSEARPPCSCPSRKFVPVVSKPPPNQKPLCRKPLPSRQSRSGIGKNSPNRLIAQTLRSPRSADFYHEENEGHEDSGISAAPPGFAILNILSIHVRFQRMPPKPFQSLGLHELHGNLPHRADFSPFSDLASVEVMLLARWPRCGPCRLQG